MGGYRKSPFLGFFDVFWSFLVIFRDFGHFWVIFDVFGYLDERAKIIKKGSKTSKNGQK
jgi:hypothetical protein